MATGRPPEIGAPDLTFFDSIISDEFFCIVIAQAVKRDGEVFLTLVTASRDRTVWASSDPAAPPSDLPFRWIAFKLKEAEDAVAITLDLKPEVEAGLMVQAQAAGLSLAQFLSRELEAIVPAAPAQLPIALPDESDQWEKELDEWLDSFPQHPVLHEDALKRENWYPDRW